MSANVDSNCKIVPLLPTEIQPSPEPRESRVAKIRVEVSEIMKKSGRSVPPNDAPPLPDELPGPGDNAWSFLLINSSQYQVSQVPK